jgi:plastocyanin
VFVQIIGNSYYPKVIEIEPGTKVTWVNEDVFTYMAGEFSGIHNAVATRGPEMFATRMLGHAESRQLHLHRAGRVHLHLHAAPVHEGRIIVRDKSVTLVDRDSPERFGGLALWAFGGMALVGTPLQARMKIPDTPGNCPARLAALRRNRPG